MIFNIFDVPNNVDDIEFCPKKLDMAYRSGNVEYKLNKKSKASLDDKELRILNSALILFVEKGFHASTLPEIAKHADVATGTIYLYFKNKEQLVNSVWRINKLKLKQTLESSVDIAKSYEENFRNIYLSYLNFAFKNTDAFSFLNLHYHYPYLTKQNLEIDKEIESFLFDFIKEGQIAGIVVEGTAALIISILDGGVVGIFRSVRKGLFKWNSKLASDSVNLAYDSICKK